MNNFNYVNLTPFKWYVRENFPFIEAEFDAMTNWDLFCKLGKEINKIIDSQNLVGEQVENLTNAFNNLKDYVDNYFENLDVQEEINQKLDEMAQDGTLAEIMASYLSTRALFVFDTVALMKQAENLENGSYVKTLGFYSKNDKGKAIYKIRTKTNEDVIDESLLIEISDTLVAELCLESIMNVKSFGAKGDSTQDDTSYIQKALNNCKDIIITEGTYMVNALTSLLPNSNQNIKLDKNAIIKAIPNNSDSYTIIKIANKENVTIKGGTIEGERDLHEGSSGEWGNGISIIQGSKNIKLENILIKNCWGDGLYINEASHIRTENIICDNNRRQGLSIISVSDYHSFNDSFINTNGTKPQAGIDIEPNLATDKLENIILENVNTKNNTGAGIMIFCGNIVNTPISIDIINHNDYGSVNGFNPAINPGISGYIRNINCNYDMSKQGAIVSPGYYGRDICPIFIENPKITNSNQSQVTVFNYATPISFFHSSTSIEEPIGNIHISGANIYNNEYKRNNTDISILDNLEPLNISIKNIIKIEGVLACRGDLILEDINRKLVNNGNSNGTIAASNVISEYNNSEASAGRTFTIGNASPKNFEYTVVNKNINNQVINVKLDTNLICRNFSPNAGITIRLANFGDSVTFMKISNTELIATKIVGTPTVV